LGRLAHDAARLPFELSAVTSAQLAVQIPPGALESPTAWEIDGKFETPQLAVNQTPLGDLNGSIQRKSTAFNYRLDGHLADGTVHAAGQWDELTPDNASGGSIDLSKLRIERLARAFPASRSLQNLSGEIDLHLPYRHSGQADWLTGSGVFRLSDIHWGRETLIDRAQGVLRLTPGRIVVENLTGRFAQGDLQGDAIIEAADLSRSRFRLSLRHAASEMLVSPWSELQGEVKGFIDAEIEGSLRRPWQARGQVRMNRGEFFSLPVVGLRLPFIARLDPGSAALAIDVNNGASQLGRGRAQIQFSATSAESVTLNLQTRFTDADLQTLLGSASSFGLGGDSRVSGTLTLSGRNVRGVRDLSGAIECQFKTLHAGGVPVVQKLQPYLTGGLSGGGFERGDLRGRISNGVMTVERLSMSGASSRVYATGRVSLAGNLDLNVSASNYQLPGGAAGSALLARIPVATTTPVGLLISANRLMANRVIYLDVTGTISSPIVQVRPLPLLGDEAVRFFLASGL
jgi:hypothetical protein